MFDRQYALERPGRDASLPQRMRHNITVKARIAQARVERNLAIMEISYWKLRIAKVEREGALSGSIREAKDKLNDALDAWGEADDKIETLASCAVVE